MALTAGHKTTTPPVALIGDFVSKMSRNVEICILFLFLPYCKQAGQVDWLMPRNVFEKVSFLM